MAVIGFSPSVEPPAPGARNESTSPCSKSGCELQAARAGAAVGPRPVGDLQAAVAEHRRGPVGRRLPEVDDQGVARHRHLVLQELEAALRRPSTRTRMLPVRRITRAVIPAAVTGVAPEVIPVPLMRTTPRPSAISGSMASTCRARPVRRAPAKSTTTRTTFGLLETRRSVAVSAADARGASASASSAARRPASASGPGGEGGRHGPKAAHTRRRGVKTATRAGFARPGPRRYPAPPCSWTPRTPPSRRAASWGFVGSSPARGSLPTPTPGCAGHRVLEAPREEDPSVTADEQVPQHAGPRQAGH